LIYKGK